MFFTRPVATALTAVSLFSSLALGAPVALGEDYEVELVGRSDLKNCLQNCQLTFNVFKPSEMAKCRAGCEKKYGKKKEKKEEKSTALVKTRSLGDDEVELFGRSDLKNCLQNCQLTFNVFKPSEMAKCRAGCEKKYGKKKEKKEEKSTALVKTRSLDFDDEDYLSRSFEDDEVALFGRSDLKNCLQNCQLTFNVFKPSEMAKCRAGCEKKYGKKKEKKEEKSTALVKTRSFDDDEVELFGRSDLKNCLQNCQLTFNVFKPSEMAKCRAGCEKNYGKKKEKKEEKSTALVKTRSLDFDDEEYLTRSFEDEEVELFGRSDLKNCLQNCQLTFNIFKPSEMAKCRAGCEKKYGKKKEKKEEKSTALVKTRSFDFEFDDE